VDGIGAEWRKSTYSGANGGNCVEVGTAPWRKSSHSGSNGGACIEVGTAVPGIAERAVVVRDTTDRDGVVLRVSAETWRALLGQVQAG
jgi:hypothetical protein